MTTLAILSQKGDVGKTTVAPDADTRQSAMVAYQVMLGAASDELRALVQTRERQDGRTERGTAQQSTPGHREGGTVPRALSK